MNGLQIKTNEETAGFTRKYGVIKKTNESYRVAK